MRLCIQGVVQDSSGNAVASPTIEVRRESDNVLVSLTSDRDGAVGITNSFTGNSDGTFRCYAEPVSQGFKVTATSGALTITLRNVHDYPVLFDADGNIASFGGNIVFPSTQLVSSNGNTLDDYEEGLWTPTFELFTPGDMTVAYGSQDGEYQKVGKWVHAWFVMSGTAFTSTGSGQVTIGGLPFSATHDFMGTLLFSGVNKSETGSPLQAYTQFCCVTATGFTSMAIECSGNGLNVSNIQKADLMFSNSPPQCSFLLKGNIRYICEVG